MLGFSEALPGAADSTAESSSPLFEDPAAADTRAESSAIVMDSTQTSRVSWPSSPDRFPTCYSRYLDTVVPGARRRDHLRDPFRRRLIVPMRIGATENGDAAYGFSETIRKGGPHPGAAAVQQLRRRRPRTAR